MGTRQFDLFYAAFSDARPFLYFGSPTSNYVLRPLYLDLWKSELLIGREVQVEVQFWSM